MTQLYRTYSSPNLKDIYSPSPMVDYDEVFYIIGDRVQVDGYRPGSVAYFGETEFGSGDWVGVVLDHPTGNHNGKIHGRQYFQCAPFHGLFVRPHRVTRIHDLNSSSVNSSRVSTPLEGFRGACGRWSKSPASSCMESYFYDEDYKTPTVASLERKLKSIDSHHHQHNNQLPPTEVTRSSFARDTSRSSTPIGILKRRSPRALSSESKTEELARRLRASIPSSPSRPSVFNFRPKRAQLDEFGLTDSSFNPQDDASDSRSDGSGLRDRGSRVTFTKELKKGDRVLVRTDRGEMPGVLRYLGETNFAIGEWAGIELDEPDGKNDGSVLDHRYFYCPQHYGLFVPVSRVQKYIPRTTSKADFKTMRSTIKSPPPLRSNSAQSSYSGSEQTTISPDKTSTPVAYDDDQYSSTTNKRSYSSGSSANSPSSDLHQNKSSSLYRHQSDAVKSHQSTPLRANTSLLNQDCSYHDASLDNSLEISNFLYNDIGSLSNSFDADIEYQLKRSMQRSAQPKKVISLNIEPLRTRSVKYTFQTSKLDGNPIAYRTVEYDN